MGHNGPRDIQATIKKNLEKADLTVIGIRFIGRAKNY